MHSLNLNAQTVLRLAVPPHTQCNELRHPLGKRAALVHEFYQVLGVRSEAADEEVKTAFRRLVKQLHPDLHPGDADRERRFQAVVRAYETLSDRQSRMAYDADLRNQRFLRRWKFRANAMTVIAAFSLTVSVGLHWRVLSQVILPAGEHTSQLARNESKAEGVLSFVQGTSPQAAEELGGAEVPIKKPERNAEPSSAPQDYSFANELVDGSPAITAIAEASSMHSLAMADLVLPPDPNIETAALQSSLPNKSIEPTAERSPALLDQAPVNEPVSGPPAITATAEAPSLQALAVADLDTAHSPANEPPQRSEPQAGAKGRSGSEAGWWIILGSFDVTETDSATTLISAGVRRASGAAQRCGMGTFNDFSAKFRGFAPGYMVVVIGPFADKAEAARSQQRVNGCIARTYVKYAQHLGE
jgi:hypothetical protein